MDASLMTSALVDPKPRPRWFKFSLRTMFVVLTLFCIAGAWVANQFNWTRERERFMETRATIVGETIRLRRDFGAAARNRKPRPVAPECLWLFGEPGRKTLLLKYSGDYETAKRLLPETECFIIWE